MSSFAETKIESMRTNPADFSWSPEEYRALFERLEREAQAAEEESRKQAHARAWELARQQGVEPIRSIEDLQGDFWPEEESVDDFLDWVRTMRQQDKPRSELE
jgi:glycerol-3-phosphate O-acyltransferase